MDLTGKLLIAMPGMPDPRFDRSVILVCAHSADGAMGLIVNKPLPELGFDELLSQLKIEVPAPAAPVPVHYGGPVETGRGFVLHSADYTGNSSTLAVGEGFGMTATLDILEDIARGFGPARAILALGYAGWGAGQLEGELAQNGWLTADAPADLVFAPEDATKWEGAIRQLGIDVRALSGAAGRA